MSTSIRKSAQRGHVQQGWLDSYHSFSFGDYYDPAYMGFSVLRVINDDVIAPNSGFGMHGHKDMEIITYMLQGKLRHEDSMGNGAVIGAGDVQHMSAGTGVMHSEVNASDSQPVRLLQILPAVKGIAPSYQDMHFAPEHKANRWCQIASPIAAEAHTESKQILKINQDVSIWATQLQAHQKLNYTAASQRSIYLQIANGTVLVNDIPLSTGDAVSFSDIATIDCIAQTDVEILLFDLPKH
jgi:quercetin 2,3-dioxygenase